VVEQRNESVEKSLWALGRHAEFAEEQISKSAKVKRQPSLMHSMAQPNEAELNELLRLFPKTS
jgi:uncharacterized Fe-S cluster-containing protein